MNSETKVVITSGYRWSYFQWFLLGLYELEKQGKISLELKLSLGSYIVSKLSNEFLLRVVNRLRMMFEEDSYNIDGYVVYSHNGKSEKKFFTIDSADAPYLFDSKKLDSVDCYFKMQCPAEFNEDGFKLTDDIIIPWCDNEHTSPELKLTERGRRKVITNFIFFAGRNRVGTSISTCSCYFQCAFLVYLATRPNLKELKIYSAIFFIVSSLCLFWGSRGGLAVMLLSFLTYINLYYFKINKKKLFIGGLVFIF